MGTVFQVPWTRFETWPGGLRELQEDGFVVAALALETRLDVARRAYGAMTELLELEVDELVIVTHGFTAGLVVAAWIGMPIEAAAGHVAFPVPSGSITTLREDAYFHNRAVVTVGEIRHLDS